MFGSNKDRLYVALYNRGRVNPDDSPYHWALLVGPKTEEVDSDATRYHIRNRIDPVSKREIWVYEALPIKAAPTSMILTRIMIAKVADNAALERVLERIPIRQGDPEWRCRHWVIEAVAALNADPKALGTKVTGNWAPIEAEARRYTDAKVASGRYMSGHALQHSGRVPTYDMLDNAELYE
jgi:hypothetical protein